MAESSGIAPEAKARSAGVRRAVIAATIGTVIEWFDYALYGAASGLVINHLFFPDLSPVAGVMAAFATFAVGFFVRPLGGIVIAHLGDRYGRKPALLLTIVLMGAATVAMGLLPTYQQVGLIAPVLLILFRLVQGFGAGAEYAGAVTLVAEYASPRTRSVLTAILQSATLVGILLATLAFLVVSALPGDALLTWAWRVPFLVSAVLFLVAIYIRNRLDETPEYVQAMASASERQAVQSAPLREVVRSSPKELLFGFLSITGHNATAYILSVFALSYMSNTLHMPRTQVLSIVVVSVLAGVIATPIMGAIAGRVGNAAVYIFGAAFSALFAFPFFSLLNSGSVALATAAMCLLYAFGFGGMAGAQGAFLANLFPTRYRFSGIALTREMSGLLVAGPTPFIATALVAADGGGPTLVSAYLCLCGVVTVAAVLAIRSRSVQEDAALA